jgi:hypothetical protein
MYLNGLMVLRVKEKYFLFLKVFIVNYLQKHIFFIIFEASKFKNK